MQKEVVREEGMQKHAVREEGAGDRKINLKEGREKK